MKNIKMKKISTTNILTKIFKKNPEKKVKNKTITKVAKKPKAKVIKKIAPIKKAKVAKKTIIKTRKNLVGVNKEAYSSKSRSKN